MKLSFEIPSEATGMEECSKMMTSSQVVTQAAHALKRSSHPALRYLNVEETDYSLVISGRVASFYLKQMAQETIMPVRGSLQLVNMVNVVTD